MPKRLFSPPFCSECVSVLSASLIFLCGTLSEHREILLICLSFLSSSSQSFFPTFLFHSHSPHSEQHERPRGPTRGCQISATTSSISLHPRLQRLALVLYPDTLSQPRLLSFSPSGIPTQREDIAAGCFFLFVWNPHLQLESELD